MKKKLITATLLSLAILAGCGDKGPDRGQLADPTSAVNADTPEVEQYLLDKHYFRKHGKNAYYGQKEDK